MSVLRTKDKTVVTTIGLMGGFGGSTAGVVDVKDGSRDDSTSHVAYHDSRAVFRGRGYFLRDSNAHYNDGSDQEDL